MNKEILMVMKYLEYPKSVSLEALEQNRDSALAVYMGDVSAEAASYYAFRTATSALAGAISALAGAIAENTPSAYDIHGNGYVTDTNRDLACYFRHSGEDDKGYLDELEATK